ncbi:MAG: PAS domain S-box protein [Bacteroidota bacterium]|nr:PAS domain S-box protein [Bacteroidota bacterium]
MSLYFLSSMLALIVLVYLVFRYKIIVNTSYDTLKSALGVIHDIIIKMDDKLKIELVRGAVSQQLGFSENEFVGKSILNLVDKKDYFETYMKFVHDGKMKEAFFDVDMINKTGNYVPMNISVTPVYTNEGVIGYVAVARNISERKHSNLIQDIVYRITKMTDINLKLKDFFLEVHNVLKEVISAPVLYVVLYDEKSNNNIIQYFNSDNKNFNHPIMNGKSLTDYVFNSSKSLFCTYTQYEEMHKNGIVDDIEEPFSAWIGVPLNLNKKTIGVIVIKHYDKIESWGSNELRLLEFVSSQIAKTIERKQVEEQILKQAALINIASNAFIVIDKNGTIDFWSQGAEKLYGWSVTDIANHKITDLLFTHHHEQFDECINSIIKTGKYQKELEQINKTGNKFFIETLWTLVKGETDNDDMILIVNTDITERKNIEAQYFRAQRLESIGILASGIAHDLNNVLAPILTSIQSLKKRNMSESDGIILNTLEACTKRGAAVVNQVLMFARGIHSETVVLRPQDLTQDIEKLIRETFPKSIKTSFNHQKDLWFINGDSTQLHQVFMNLVINARDAMPDGGTISVNLENFLADTKFAKAHLHSKEGPYILITVSDTGTGIPPEYLNKIFEPFFTTKEVGKGTGLGLATCDSIIKNHNGFLSVYSEKDKGTSFKIYLPAICDETQISEEQYKQELHSVEGLKILLVDDEAAIREISKDVLETYGYVVTTAANGGEAIGIYSRKNTKFDLILTDLEMPVMNGIELVRELRKKDKKTKIIVSSGLFTEEKLKEISDCDVKLFLPKPYTAEKLISTIQDVLQVDGKKSHAKK